MNTKKIALTIGAATMFVVGFVALVRYVLTIDYIQSPLVIEWQKPIVYRNESQTYKIDILRQRARKNVEEINAYFKEYGIATPSATMTPTPTMTQVKKSEYDIVMAQPHGDKLWKIYQLETQRGLTDRCRIDGNGYGGFGVMSDGEVICYNTFELAAQRANYWFDKNYQAQGKDLEETLRVWVGGQEANKQAYIANYKSL